MKLLILIVITCILVNELYAKSSASLSEKVKKKRGIYSGLHSGLHQHGAFYHLPGAATGLAYATAPGSHWHSSLYSKIPGYIKAGHQPYALSHGGATVQSHNVNFPRFPFVQQKAILPQFAVPASAPGVVPLHIPQQQAHPHIFNFQATHHLHQFTPIQTHVQTVPAAVPAVHAPIPAVASHIPAVSAHVPTVHTPVPAVHAPVPAQIPASFPISFPVSFPAQLPAAVPVATPSITPLIPPTTVSHFPSFIIPQKPIIPIAVPAVPTVPAVSTIASRPAVASKPTIQTITPIFTFQPQFVPIPVPTQPVGTAASGTAGTIEPTLPPTTSTIQPNQEGAPGTTFITSTNPDQSSWRPMTTINPTPAAGNDIPRPPISLLPPYVGPTGTLYDLPQAGNSQIENFNRGMY